MVKRNPESRIEEYRRHLRASVEELLESVDEIMDFCYTESISSIHIEIDVNADSTIPRVTYSAEHLVNPNRIPKSSEMKCEED